MISLYLPVERMQAHSRSMHVRAWLHDVWGTPRYLCAARMHMAAHRQRRLACSLANLFLDLYATRTGARASTASSCLFSGDASCGENPVRQNLYLALYFRRTTKVLFICCAFFIKRTTKVLFAVR
jgi:hypothetical protein